MQNNVFVDKYIELFHCVDQSICDLSAQVMWIVKHLHFSCPARESLLFSLFLWRSGSWKIGCVCLVNFVFYLASKILKLGIMIVRMMWKCTKKELSACLWHRMRNLFLCYLLLGVWTPNRINFDDISKSVSKNLKFGSPIFHTTWKCTKK